MLNVISQPLNKLFNREKGVKSSKPSYEYKLRYYKSVFRYFSLKKQIYAKLLHIEKKMIDVISFENFAKLTRNSHLLKTFLLEQYQPKALDLLPAPKEEINLTLDEYMLKFNRDNNIEKKLLKLLEEAQKNKYINNF
jgi:hypothetical protein